MVILLLIYQSDLNYKRIFMQIIKNIESLSLNFTLFADSEIGLNEEISNRVKKDTYPEQSFYI